MFNKAFLTFAAIAALGLSALSTPAHAQQQDTDPNASNAPPVSVGRGEGENNRYRSRSFGSRDRGNRGPSPEQVMAAAQAQITAAGVACQVTEAVSPGRTAERVDLYEVACASGPGYMIVASEPPVTSNCIELSSSNADTRARDPEAQLGLACTLPANLNELPVFAAWAREAGVNCTVDQGRAVGRNNAGNLIYEIGCNTADGYWIERAGSAWQATDCMQIMSTNAQCRFTTVGEQIAGFRPLLTGTEAAACDVQQMRLMGQNANGRFIELKCANAGEGFIARVRDNAIQQVYPCATAQQIGGGCTLTPAPATGGRA